jgi:hypothetical protein
LEGYFAGIFICTPLVFLKEKWKRDEGKSEFALVLD